MRRFCRICFIWMTIGLLISFPANLHSEIQERDYNIIRVAFMNGCIETFHELKDEKEFQKLKEDEVALKAFVRDLAERYMSGIIQLNRKAKE